MTSKSKKAISSLKKHLNDIDAISSVQEGNTWKASLKDTINLYIGEHSSITQRLDKLYFTRKEHSTVEGVIGIFTDHVYDDTKKQNFKNLIETSIKHIEANGIYKNPDKKNILQSFSNAEVISGLVFIILLVFGIGNYFGRIERDKDSLRTEDKIKELEKENNSLKLSNDSLKFLINNPTIKEQQTHSDTTKH